MRMQDKDIRTFADFAEWKKTEHDNMFAIRVLKQLFTTICNTTNVETLAHIFQPPSTTGDNNWDRLLCGVAIYAVNINKFPLEWASWAVSKPTCPSSEIFDPANQPRWFAVNYSKTPIELKERAVCLAKGNLQGV